MKRDMDLIREILRVMEEYPHAYAPEEFDVGDSVTDEQLGYHVWLLADAGLITATESKSRRNNGPSAVPLALTWAGHEFVAATRPPGRWAAVKETCRKAGDVPFEVLKALLVETAKKSVGLDS